LLVNLISNKIIKIIIIVDVILISMILSELNMSDGITSIKNNIFVFIK